MTEITHFWLDEKPAFTEWPKTSKLPQHPITHAINFEDTFGDSWVVMFLVSGNMISGMRVCIEDYKPLDFERFRLPAGIQFEDIHSFTLVPESGYLSYSIHVKAGELSGKVKVKACAVAK